MADPDQQLANTANARPASDQRPRKRSFTIAGHRTSITLENAFWIALRDISRSQNRSLTELITEIDRGRGDAGLSSAVRVWILHHHIAAQSTFSEMPE